MTEYVKKGGKLLTTLGGTKIPGGNLKGSVCEMTGFKGLKPSRNDVEFARFSKDSFNKGIPEMDFVIHGSHYHGENRKGVKAFGKLVHPSTSSIAFVKHQAPASDKPSKYPVVLSNRFGKGHVVSSGTPLFSAYFDSGSPACRDLIMSMIEEAFSSKTRLINVNGPTGLEVSILEKDNKLYLHLLFCPRKRARGLTRERGISGGAATQLFDNVPPVFDIKIDLHPKLKIKKARLPLSKKKLSLRRKNNRIILTVPKVHIHEIVELVR